MKKTSLLAISAAALGIVAVPTAAHAATVNVTSGDTLWSVAQQRNTSVEKLEQLNNNVNPYSLQVGMQLQVPDNNNQGTTQNNNTKSIIVKSGDTLSALAVQYDTTVENLMSINHLTSDVIYVGQVLQLQQTANNTQNAVKDTKQQVTVQHQQNNYAVSNNTNTTASNNNNNHNYVAKAATTNYVAPKTTTQQVQTNNTTSTSSTLSGSAAAAANAIAQAESGGSYTAVNGRYYGKYQLDISYLHGNLSPANQDRVFQQYCNQRYGSVQNALAFREAHGWY